MINALQAQAFIVSHNHKATFTPDGLLAISWASSGIARFEAMEGNRDEDDIWFEEPMVFPIDESGMVDLKPIKAWLGY